LVNEIDPNHDGTITPEEFNQVMKHIEQRINSLSANNTSRDFLKE
jgi:Ca2+-binding EF-hand superfamily protein